MKKIIFSATVASVFLFAFGNTRAQEISFSMFYSSLSPYGDWVNVGDYGMCWRPSGVGADWQPYTFGHWVWTDYGWTWVSGYSWGWAPFHYGRWFVDPAYGWVWVPGYVWAPAWVEWRWGGGYCGWAPLPPGFHFRVDVVVGPDERDFGVGMRGWCFVDARDMGRTRYRFVDREGVPRVIGITRNVTRIRFTQQGVYNVGLSRENVERVSRRRIETVNVVRTNEVSRQRVVGNSVRIYSPVPFVPRVRNEKEAIQHERVNQAPQRIRTGQSNPARQRQEMSQPRFRPERAAPQVNRQREENVRPKNEATHRERYEAKHNDKNDKDKKGPVRHR